jgi:hypothetical protein
MIKSVETFFLMVWPSEDFVQNGAIGLNKLYQGGQFV